MAFDLQLAKTGIAVIDEQHAQLLSCLDRLEYWVARGSGVPAALEALAALVDYIRNHFAFEEAYLLSHGFPKLEEHIKEHEAITAEVEKVEQLLLSGANIEDSLVILLRKWIMVHIGAEDAEYAEFFREHTDKSPN